MHVIMRLARMPQLSCKFAIWSQVDEPGLVTGLTISFFGKTEVKVIGQSLYRESPLER